MRDLLNQLFAERDLLVTAVCAATGRALAEEREDRLRQSLEALPTWLRSWSKASVPQRLLAEMWQGDRTRNALGGVLLGWLLLHDFSQRLGFDDDRHGLDLIRSLGLDFAWQEKAGTSAQQAEVALTMELLQQPLTPHPATDAEAFNALCMAPQLTTLLGINQHAGTTWFREEGLATLAGAVALQAVFTSALASPTLEPDFEPCAATLRLRLARAAACGCRLDKFLQLG